MTHRTLSVTSLSLSFFARELAVDGEGHDDDVDGRVVGSEEVVVVVAAAGVATAVVVVIVRFTSRGLYSSSAAFNSFPMFLQRRQQSNNTRALRMVEATCRRCEILTVRQTRVSRTELSPSSAEARRARPSAPSFSLSASPVRLTRNLSAREPPR